MAVIVEEIQGDRIFVIRDFLAPEACAALIARAERAGFEEAPINAGGEAVLARDVRNNARVMEDDPGLAAEWWRRAAPFLAGPVREAGETWEPVGFNERFRFYRYDPGERFAPHLDGSFVRPDGERSLRTFLVYLNDGCAGGETRFYFPLARSQVDVRPETGKALVFLHRTLHKGAPVVRGRKYVLRTDVMYHERRGRSEAARSLRRSCSCMTDDPPPTDSRIVTQERDRLDRQTGRQVVIVQLC